MIHTYSTFLRCRICIFLTDVVTNLISFQSYFETQGTTVCVLKTGCFGGGFIWEKSLWTSLAYSVTLRGTCGNRKTMHPITHNLNCGKKHLKEYRKQGKHSSLNCHASAFRVCDHLEKKETEDALGEGCSCWCNTVNMLVTKFKISDYWLDQ